MNPYGYFPSADMHFQNPQFPPDFMSAYLQQMHHAAPNAFDPTQFMAPPQQQQQQQMPVEQKTDVAMLNDSGHHTLTPLASPPSSSEQPHADSSAHTSPHFPPPPKVEPTMQMHSMSPMNQMAMTPTPLQPVVPVNSAYAINSLLKPDEPSSTKSSPTLKSEEPQEKENATKRRNTAPASSGLQRKRRQPDCPTPARPTPTLPMHPNMIPGYPVPGFSGYPGFPGFVPFVDALRGARDLCLICGDSSTGYHYGVLSCEGCKGFFRRTIQKQMTYTCMKGEQCTFSYESCSFNRSERTRCQACRFARCVKMGMNKDNVRRGLDKEKEKPLPEKKHKRSLTPEGLAPAVEELYDAFSKAMSVSSDVASTSDFFSAIRAFIRGVEALNQRFPGDDQQLDPIISKMFGGLATLRVAFSMDPVPFVQTNATTVAQLREGLRNTVLMDEGVALLSATYILNFTDSDSGELRDTYRCGLRDYFKSTRTQNPGAYDRLLTKTTRLL